ncbi:MAG: hypothetical protein PSX37_02740 [bacterium]|nr:hypothetical protein [bacterium]
MRARPRLTATIVASGAAVMIGIGLYLPTSAAAAPPKFRTCVALNSAFASGVASTTAAAAAAVASGFRRPTVNKALYNSLIAAVPGLDRPKNGIACEVRVASQPPAVPTPMPPTPTPAPTPAPTPSPTTSALDGSSRALLTTTHNKSTGITARLQWNANSGYCGETNFITALMRNGGYTSQWTARAFAMPSGGSEASANSQLLLGSNGHGITDLQVAQSMRLLAEDYGGSTETNTNDFLAWIKAHVLADETVIIGVYNNVPMLGESGSGDPIYDHIVPVVGVGSNHPLSGSSASTYYNDDIVTISDNGLYTPITNDVPSNSPENPATSAMYTFNVDEWQNYRAGANTSSSDTSTYDLYSAPILISGAVQNFGTAVTGIIDNTTGGPAAIAVDLTSNVNNEGFQDQAVLSSAPAGTPMTLTATAHPVDGTEYNVYVYDDFADVPLGNFNTAAASASHAPDYAIPASNGGLWSQTISLRTDETRIFRIVPVSAL